MDANPAAAPPCRRLSAYERLVELIAQGAVPPGAPLPPEPVLMARLGLSRTSLREAMARLHAEGRTVSRRGAGTFLVRDTPLDLVRLAPIDGAAGLLEWHELRVALESEAAMLAAERRTPADLAALEAAQRVLLGRLDAGDRGGAEDARFHAVLAEASGNRRLHESVAMLNRHIQAWIDVSQVRAILTLHERREIVVAEHAAIIAAVRAGRPEAARAALRHHLLNGRARVLGSLAR